MSSVKLNTNSKFNGTFNLVNNNALQIGTKKGLYKIEFRNLRPNTKYKLFVQIQNHTNAGGNGSKTEEYYDISRLTIPHGTSRKVNSISNINDPSDYKSKSSGRLWNHSYFLSDRSGSLNIKTLFSSASDFLNPVNRWFKNVSEEVRKNAKLSYALLPVSDVVSTNPSNESAPWIKRSTATETIPVIINPTPTTEEERTVTQNLEPDLIQTFVVDPNSLNGSKYVDLTDVVLFFRAKPDRLNNRSGIDSPGVTLSIIEVEGENPLPQRQYQRSILTLDYSAIIASSDATVGTEFSFLDPIRLLPGKKYGFAIAFEDPDYQLWTCVQGERLIGTNTPSVGPTNEHRGDLYRLFSSTYSPTVIGSAQVPPFYKKKDNEDLKFDINVADYDVSNTVTFNVKNNDNEFVVVSNLSSEFFASEYVYQAAANATGTISITGGEQTLIGTGTTFTSLNENEKIVLIDSTNTEIVEVVEIESIISDTEAYIAEPVLDDIAGNYVRTLTAKVENYFPTGNELILSESTANSTTYLTTSSSIVGVDSQCTANVSSLSSVPVSVFSTNLDLALPSTYKVSGTYNFAYASGNTYVLSTDNNALDFFAPNHVRNYAAEILSKSTEMVELSGAKSANIQMVFEYDGPRSDFTFESPILTIDGITFSTTRWLINDDITNEHTRYGFANTKHISKKLTFEQGNAAEDIRVIYNGYRPLGTDIRCFAKIQNSQDPDAFDDKSWTLLELKRGAGEFSSKENTNDYREYEFGFPDFPPTSETLIGTVDTESENSNNTIIGSGTEFANTTTGLANGDIIRVYNPLFPDDNYGVFSIDTVVSDTELLLTEQVANVNIIGTGFKIDKLSTPYTGFNNKDNANIVRYFGQSGEIYDTYSIVSIKTVLTSNDPKIVPKVNDYRVIGVSA